LYGVGMDIPAGESGVTHSFSYPFPGDYLFWAVFGHMHTLGRSLKLTIGDGADANCLLNIPAWDFDWQRTYRLAEPQLIREDEELHLDCVWDNPTDQDVAWGDGTGDEMCLGVLLMTDP
ncbi:MAG: hypothetical protein KDK70_44060, partial [Myxococcales bacterium]|nr:hypothetical protein [Myxococcales bacterium]